VLLAAATLIGAVFLAGCGSSSKSKSSSASTASAHAAKPHLTAVRGVAAPAPPTPGSLAKLARVRKGSAVTSQIVGISNQPTLEGKLRALDADLDKFWSTLFAQANLQWPETSQAFVSTGSVQTQCNTVLAATDPSALCQNTFYWTLPWLEQNVAKPQGEVALTTDVAITWSFHVQDVLGVTSELQNNKLTKHEYGDQALCLTGLWVRSLSQRNLFQTGDAEAAEKYLKSLTGVDNITAPDVTTQSLEQSFFAGYNSGDPSSCKPGSSTATGTQTTTAPSEPPASP
jgi:predicted metalloprotease